ncbi:fumarylacetoacetase [Nonlabens agnitus]|uniref:fumarylacetoacetase n=1 Tax=Nonlabens agnitus TaxID=870484 RepID=A0A2S9WR81_9FLAO|nr:fumarylacetoacetase [Nonlabens agnitus]PRP65995.1 fumarylacetoacetase [Nonlabens agnitus]
MPAQTNNPNRRSWIGYSKDSHFPIQNIPFGVFLTRENVITIGTRIGDHAIDLGALQELGYFADVPLTDDMFMQDTLNDFISDGKKTWRLVRNRIGDIFDKDNDELRDHKENRDRVIFHMDEVEMQLPVLIGDYTDFYSSKEHAINVGSMFRDKENALMPNWIHMPIAYHGRSSSIIPSGINIHRPKGQMLNKDTNEPVFGPSKKVDFELETAFITTDANKLGEPIDIKQAEDYIFGMVLLNDWSARDIQKWEYAPLGPFLGKNFATSISPWIVTMDALEPFRCAGPEQEKTPLKYLNHKPKSSFDIHLEVDLTPENGTPTTLTKSNFKHLYWSMSQQLAHHTINGCRINSGDLMGSGTISGPVPDSYGSLLELSWNGEQPIRLNDGTQRSFVNDKDTITMRGYCNNNSVRIGFGEVSNKLIPSYTATVKGSK